MIDTTWFAPEKHEYVTHKTYTGPGCAICGRGPEVPHMPPKPKRNEQQQQ